MKEKDLKALVKEVVRECITEVKKKRLNEAGLTSEKNLDIDPHDDENREIRLLNGLQTIVKQLLILRGQRTGGMQEAAYKQVSPNETDTAKEDKARTIQTDPKVNEAAYKQVAPNETDTAKEDKARTIQTDPKVTEAQVQHRSAKTVKDLDNDPNNVRAADVPQA